MTTQAQHRGKKMDIDIDDYKRINRHTGRIVGFNSDVVLLDDMEVELLQKFANDFTKAKAVLIDWTISSQTNSERGLSIHKTMTKIHDIVDDTTEVIFGSNTDTTLKSSECRYHMILTGIKEQKI